MKFVPYSGYRFVEYETRSLRENLFFIFLWSRGIFRYTKEKSVTVKFQMKSERVVHISTGFESLSSYIELGALVIRCLHRKYNSFFITV